MTSMKSVLVSSNLPADIGTTDETLETILEALQSEDKIEAISCTTTESQQMLKFVEVNKESRSVDWSRTLKHLKLANDCHSYNVVLRGGASRKLRLTTSRPIPQGKALSLWFGPDLLAAFRVPFLTPLNIKGEKSYTCHKCNKTYEYPNPLKIHLSLENCQENISLINILRKLLNNTDKDKNSLNPNNCIDVASGQDTTTGNVVCTTRRDVISHRSAFTPYRQRTSDNVHTQLSIPMPPAQLPIFPSDLSSSGDRRLKVDSQGLIVFPLVSASNGVEPLPKSYRDQIDNMSEQRAVDMETFVSNLGKLKHGHLCLYCGKVYSRKYGLKIHIRTHTGFKPLKCKYCLRPFGDPSNLNKHVRLHAQGETPYRCEECGKILVRRRDLERHMKSRHHTGFGRISDNTSRDNNIQLAIT